MILTISSILIILAILLLPVSSILNVKISHLIFEDYLNRSFKYRNSWGFIKNNFLFHNKKELLSDTELLNQIKLYNILVIIIYCCFVLGLAMFFFNIIQNNRQ